MPVVDGLLTNAAFRMAHCSVASNGTLIYAAGAKVEHTTPVGITRDGKVSGKLDPIPGNRRPD